MTGGAAAFGLARSVGLSGAEPTMSGVHSRWASLRSAHPNDYRIPGESRDPSQPWIPAFAGNANDGELSADNVP